MVLQADQEEKATTTLFGITLKRFREARRLSQSKLAKRAGFNHSYVSRLESGARTPTQEAVENLANALRLEGSESDELLVSAGFLPKDPFYLLAGEPEIAELLAALKDPRLPDPIKAKLRASAAYVASWARISSMYRRVA